MGASSFPTLPDDSAIHALIPQPPISSSPSSSTAPAPLQPASPPSLHPAFHPHFERFDLSSSSSSSSSLVPEITRPPLDNVPRRRKNRGLHRRNRDGTLGNDGKWKQPRPPDKGVSKLSIPESPSGCKENACCKCAAGFTADCAAICCCPLALLHLLALTFIKLPSTVAWRLLVSMKKRLCSKRSPTDVPEEDSPRPNFTPPWSFRDSPDGSDPLAHVVRFDSQKLWKHFEAGHLGFGGLSMKRD